LTQIVSTIWQQIITGYRWWQYWLQEPHLCELMVDKQQIWLCQWQHQRLKSSLMIPSGEPSKGQGLDLTLLTPINSQKYDSEAWGLLCLYIALSCINFY
jgi:hypothetical protein